MRVLHWVLFCTLLVVVSAFTKEDHEIFRLREEVEGAEGPGVSFYDFIGVSPSATWEEIDKAFRRKSRTLHPDKARNSFIAARSTPKPKKKGEKRTPGVHVSKGPTEAEIKKFTKEATQRYSRLGVVASVLKGPQRERYDHFLRHGFPAWKGTGYYYSRYRPGLGTVLFGLFLAGGGVAHYLALKISYTRQRDFIERYIRQARKSAWGDETGIQGIPGISTPAEVPSVPESEESDAPAKLNRRQKREYERQQKKDKARGKGTAVAEKAESKVKTVSTPTGTKRRVVAENGKVLIVDSLGNVFLEETDEDGNVEEFLLDLDELHKPTFADTAVVKLPLWLWNKALTSFGKGSTDSIESSADAAGTALEKDTENVDNVAEPESVSLAPGSTVQDLSASQISDNGFEIVDASAIEEEAVTSASQKSGIKKRRKGKK
ncbi:hypothetical protein DV738_g2657, partial [Chaetothyriales sp. CBS 135597]